MNIYPINYAKINKTNDYELFLIETINNAIKEKLTETLSKYIIFIPLSSIFREREVDTLLKVLKMYKDEGYIIDNGLTRSGLGVEISW